jgi:RDD family
MNTRLWIALLAAGALLLAFGLGGGAGVSINFANGVGTYEASSSVLSLLGGLAILITYSITLEPTDPKLTGSRAGVGRRGVAWFIDFLLSLTALTSVLALIPLTAEALATGQFAWEFQRSQITVQDWLLTLIVVGLAFVGMGFYWAVPVMRGGQTVGQCIFGLRVIPAAVVSLSPWRVWLRGLAQPFAPLFWLVKLVSGKYWLDEVANTKVVRVLEQSSAAA